ncbi:hypothetical protein AbraIFM66951_009726, partial [Aspergillus brasiliensis]
TMLHRHGTQQMSGKSPSWMSLFRQGEPMTRRLACGTTSQMLVHGTLADSLRWPRLFNYQDNSTGRILTIMTFIAQSLGVGVMSFLRSPMNMPEGTSSTSLSSPESFSQRQPVYMTMVAYISLSRWQENPTEYLMQYRCDAVHHIGMIQAESLPTSGLEGLQFVPGPHFRAIPDYDRVPVSRAQLASLVAEVRRCSTHEESDQFELGPEAATSSNVAYLPGSVPPRPASRRNFEIAIICALTVEQDAVHAVFDHYWDDNGPAYDKHPGDPNAYSCGAIGRHNVVLVHMPGMGKASAAAVAAHCRVSFPNLKLALIVGVCGALPLVNTDQEIILGDVIIGEGIIQYDFGRQYPDRFVRRNTLLDSLGRPSPEIRAHLAKLKSHHGRASLLRAMDTHLRFLQSDPQFKEVYRYPGTEQDVLYKPESNIVVSRRRLQQARPKPCVHFGAIASGDTLMRSGTRRDTIATEERIVAFEME